MSTTAVKFLFLAIQPSTCSGGGILAYFVEKIR